MTPDQEKKLDKIHELLAGSLEKKGLVHRMGEMEEDVAELKSYKLQDEKLKNKVAGGVAISIPILTGAWNWILKHF